MWSMEGGEETTNYPDRGGAISSPDTIEFVNSLTEKSHMVVVADRVGDEGNIGAWFDFSGID